LGERLLYWLSSSSMWGDFRFASASVDALTVCLQSPCCWWCRQEISTEFESTPRGALAGKVCKNATRYHFHLLCSKDDHEHSIIAVKLTHILQSSSTIRRDSFSDSSTGPQINLCVSTSYIRCLIKPYVSLTRQIHKILCFTS